MTGYRLLVFVHLLSAVVWLGGMVAFALLAPVLRRVQDDGLRQGLFHALGTRFRTIGWIAIGLLVLTGVGQLHARGWWGMEWWTTRASATPAGRAMLWKLGTALLMIAVQAVHDFWLGPLAGRVEAGSERARRLRRRAAWLARGNAVLGILLLWWAVRVVRG